MVLPAPLGSVEDTDSTAVRAGVSVLCPGAAAARQAGDEILLDGSLDGSDYNIDVDVPLAHVNEESGEFVMPTTPAEASSSLRRSKELFPSFHQARSLKRTATVEELLKSARDDAAKQFAAGEEAARKRADALLSERTAAKVLITGESEPQCLLEAVEPERLPTIYGGQCSCQA